MIVEIIKCVMLSIAFVDGDGMNGNLGEGRGGYLSTVDTSSFSFEYDESLSCDM